MLRESEADIICLQEVTSILLQQILQSSYFQSNYFLSGNGFQGYGLLTLSRFPVRFFEERFISTMGRSVIIAEIPFAQGEDEKVILVGNTHLESAQNQEAREFQLK